MPRIQPGLEPFGGQRDRIGPGDADRVEAERPGPFDEGAFQRLSV
ncbi:hypothetical protein [Microvirga mediterraneensis]